MSEVKIVNLKINGIDVSVPEGTSILTAAARIGIRIPTLCYLKELGQMGACRVCVVEIKGARNLAASCVYPVAEGMEVFTNTQKVVESRRKTIELLLSDHRKDCLSCTRNLNCELQTLSHEYSCDSSYYEGERNEFEFEPDLSTVYLERDNSKCILCRRCVETCRKIQDVGVIAPSERGFKTNIACAFDSSLHDTPCVACGQCINVCPTGALHEKEEINDVLKAISDPEKVVVVAAAPSVRAGLGELFGYPMGTNVEGKMLSALRLLGFDKIFDVNFAADVTIMEEANELIERVTKGGKLPMFTSCSPGWINYVEYYYPDLIPNLSSCKSPQQMFGALTKTYYADKMGIDPKNIYVVSLMPCVAKKYEKTREAQNASGYPDVDAVLTSRELGKMIKQAGIMFDKLPEGQFDNPMGDFTGAGIIFGTTGGVMEAALRTAVEKITGKQLDKIEFEAVRGTEGIKKASYKVGDLEVKVAVASGLANAKKICDEVRSGKADYHFIEIMCCPGGCVNGGGQPIIDALTRNSVDYKAIRAKVLYDKDNASKIRKSHENPYVKDLYENYLKMPGSHKAHSILHTNYQPKPKY